VSVTPEAGMNRGAAGGVIWRAGSTFLTFAAHVVLARSLSISGYGEYVYLFGVLALVWLVTQFGMEMTLLRYVAAYAARHEWGAMKGVIRCCFGTVALLGLLSAVLLSVRPDIMVNLLRHVSAETVRVGAWLIPLVSLIALLQAVGISLHRPVSSIIPYVAGRPLVFLLLLVALRLWRPGGLSPAAALGAQVVATCLAAAAIVPILVRAWPVEAGRGVPARYAWGEWFRVSVPFLVLAELFQVAARVDLVMVGRLLGTADAGLYGAAVRLALLIQIGVSAVNAVTAPRLSAAYALQDRAQLQATADHSVLLMGIGGLVGAGGLIVFAPLFLRILGPAYLPGALAMRVLVLGQIPMCFAGSCGFLLSMTGNQNRLAAAVGIACACNVAGNLLLIPRMGIAGAAWATAASNGVLTLLMVCQGRRRLGVDSFLPITLWRRWRSGALERCVG
jgi:O-antigen/teichoic acid export membrane protein